MQKLFIFDFDGTLADTQYGIAAPVNKTRADFGFPPLPREVITSYTGDGVRKLIERSFSDVVLPVSQDDAVKQMLRNYEAAPAEDSFLYPGVLEGFKTLHEAGHLLAVVSNKPVSVSEKALIFFGLLPYLKENIGDGSGFPLKPAPDALFYLMKKYQVTAEQIWMVGDNHTDLDFAENAGVRSIFCKYGFGKKKDAVPTVEVETFSEFVELALKPV